MNTTNQIVKNPDELDIFWIISSIKKRKKFITTSTAIFGGIALITSLSLPPIYVATTTIIPPQQQNSSMSAILGQLGSMGAAGSLIGTKNTNDLYIGILQSKSIADQLIKKFNLMQHFGTTTLTDSRSSLSTITTITSTKTGLINISVEDKDPKFAANLANAYTDELSKLNQKLAITDAAKRRLFFEQQLKNAKNQLDSSESLLKKTQETTGLLQPDSQIQAMITRTVQLQAQIASKEVQLSTIRSFAAAQNPEVLKTQQELQSLKKELDKLEINSSAAEGVIVPTRTIPQTGLEYIRRLRDVKYNEAMFELLSKQFESAKLDEARDSSAVQILDIATTPDKKSKPNRGLIVAIGIIIGFFFGLGFTLLREKLPRSKQSI